MLNPRERRLLTVVLVVIAVYAGYGVLQWLVLEPLRSRQSQLAALEADISRKRLQQRQVLRAQEQYEEWLKKSLPSDISRAQSIYQEFLLTAVSLARLSDTAVTTMPPSPQGDIMTRLPYTVRARGSLRQLVELLRYFYGVDVLHQIRQLTIRRRDGGDDLDIEMRIEAVSLRDAPESMDQPLRPNPQTLAALGLDDQLVRFVTEKNILTPYRPPAPSVVPASAPPREQRSEPELDPAEFVYAVGRVVVADQTELWLYDRLNNELHRIREGEQFSLAGVQGRVVQVLEDGAVIETMESSPRRLFLELGSNLRQMREVAGASSVRRSPEIPGVALSAGRE